MAYKMFAAIYVGSCELAIKIYEINAKKTFKLVDGVSRIIELGKDTYSKGSLSAESVNLLCDTINDFKKKMKEYQVTEYRAYATSAVREAKNSELVLDAIKCRTNIDVKVLSNSEQRYISFKGLFAKYTDYHEVVTKNTVIVDVGAGSVQVSLFDKTNLVITENIHIGAVRVRDYLTMAGTRAGRLDKILSEYVEGDIVTFRNIYLNDKGIKNIIAVGEVVDALKKLSPDLAAEGRITRAQFEDIYDRIVALTPQELSERYGIPYERATLMLPNIIIYMSFLNNCKAEELYAPNVDFGDGIVASYMDEGSRVVFGHNFEEDIVASANAIAKRYKCDRNHVEQVKNLAIKIFDGTKGLHGLGKMERLQLQIAAILHDCGNYINLNNGAINSHYIIANTEIIGLSHKERMEVANIVKYNILNIPPKDEVQAEFGECDYVVIAKLVAMLRIANILDKSHNQKFDDIAFSIKDDKLIISAKTFEDITLESGLFAERADYFETVFGVRPVLRLRKGV